MEAAVLERRADAIADPALGGRDLCRRLADVTDDWLRRLYADAVAGVSRRKGAVALVAVGGYGRGELAPQSDIDVVLVHQGAGRAREIDELAGALWYPLWDSGVRLGHAVRSFDEQLTLAARDLDSATALLTARWVAGDEALADRLATEGRTTWRRSGRRWLESLRANVLDRREQAGDVAYLLEPDLKEGHGGLRDVHTMWWAADAGLVLPEEDQATLERCYGSLVAARVELHRETRRRGDVLRLEDQDAVATRLGRSSSDELMAEIAAAARSIAWIADEAWRAAARERPRREEQAGLGLAVVSDEIVLTAATGGHDDPTLVLRASTAAAARGIRLARATLDRLAEDVDPDDWRQGWPDGALTELVALLRQGHRAIDVFEALDQRGLLVELLPEWDPVRSRPQRNAYHRYTVDRHLWEAAANAAALTDRVSRPDLLVLGALFHDLGKGYPGDHTAAGVELMGAIGPRLGLPPDDVATLVRLIAHHLLLPETAVRRDLTDPATIRLVADAVGDADTLELLHALTEADATATGPSAWGSWKAQLVAELVARTRVLLERRAQDGAADDDGDATDRRLPDEATLSAMAAGRLDIRIEGDGDLRVRVVCDDVPGAFARVAGVLSLRGLDVLSAWAHSAELGGPAMAASEFVVMSPPAGIDRAAVADDLRRALAGELAIEARLAERAQTYRRRRPVQAAPAGPPSVIFHDDASSTATVIEVRAPNRIGVLHRITRALADLGLDIRHATVQSLGEDVVDTFYVLGHSGRLVTDGFHRAEIGRAVLFAVS